jgi:hypothetical protein
MSDPMVMTNLLAEEPPIDPLVTSLLKQVGVSRARRQLQKGVGQPPDSGRFYQLKVTLEGIRPSIWRRIQAPGNITLPGLHAILQIAMGWTNSHLHGFKVEEQFYTEPSPDFAEDRVMDERPVRLNQIAPEVGAKFFYEYDFGDSWKHALVVEQILPPDPDAAYPRCIDGKRACPLEDVGGIPGYAEFLAAIRGILGFYRKAIIAFSKNLRLEVFCHFDPTRYAPFEKISFGQKFAKIKKGNCRPDIRVPLKQACIIYK